MSVYSLGQIRKIVSGKGALDTLSDIVASLNAKNAVIITDAGVFKAGLTVKAEALLNEAGCNVSVINDVPPEPSYMQVNGIYQQAKAHACDFIVAIGGGSAMDTSKLVSLMLKNDITLEEMLKGKKPTTRGVPTVMVPTTAGTGSEATPNAIVLVPEENLKVGIVTDLMISDTVILDPEMTAGLPQRITANTGIDALCHLMECYISKKANPLSDTFALSGIKKVARSLRKAYQNGKDLDAREDMLLASCFGGIAIASSSTTAIHALSYPLGGRYHIPHGLSNAILMPLVMDVNKPCCIKKYVEMAKAMELDTEGKSDEEIADLFVKELYSLNADLEIKCDLKEKGITADIVDELVEAASKVTRLLGNNPKDLTKEEMKEIYLKLIAANQ
ncbi:iron-containing alcohol dehydrogenase [uncultured Succinatimonas sp.]|uniref:iron-containing alcohol dehydrogenase n=1 Tax=uncultured Succinatimonas sp. TaxID=1262973 RepID=UPI0025D4A161|nr:iron-containing alcohol dehydrogenase [uncultured Succinatimonas sp.]